MKAIGIYSYGGPEVLKEIEVSVPEISDNEVLIKVAAVSVNPVDWKVRKGNLKLITGKRFPFIPGTEVAGVVEKYGKNVENLKEGQRVYAGLSYMGGGYAEYVKTSANKVFILPDNIDFTEACTFGVAGVTAYQGLVRHGKIEEGMEVMINGASGGVGTYAVQIAKLFKAVVTAVCSDSNFDLVKSLGADKFVDYKKQDPVLTGKYDIILDTVGTLGFLKACKALKKGGRYVNTLPRPKLFFWQTVTSLTGGKRASGIILRMYREDLHWIRDQVGIKNIKVVIDRIYPLSEARQAHEYSETLRAKGKIVLGVGESG